MYSKQEIILPIDCFLVNHDFYNYDPKLSFNIEDSVKYLNEDLFQCKFPLESLIIDLGWYGETTSSKGEFRIYIIQNENWEIPLNIIHSSSVEETRDLLNKILQYYTSKEVHSKQ